MHSLNAARSGLMKKGLLIVFIPFLINFIWIGLFYRSLAETSARVDRSSKDGDVLLVVSDCISSMNSIIIAADRFVQSLGSDKKQKDLVLSRSESLLQSLQALRELSKSDSEIRATSDHVAATIQSLKPDMERLAAVENPLEIDFEKSMSPERFLSAVNDSKILLAVMQKRADEFDQALNTEEKKYAQTRWIALSGLAVNILVAVLLAILMQRDITGRLALIVQKTEKLGLTGYDSTPLSGNDELNILDLALAEAHELLVEQASFKRAFTDLIGRSLHRPLQKCTEAAEKLQSTGPPLDTPRALKSVNTLRSTAASCLNLIDSLLILDNSDLSGSADKNDLPVDCRPTDIAAVTNAAIIMLSSLTQARNLTIESAVAPQIVACDGMRIKQVLVNLLSNAIKFSAADSTIVIDSTADAKNFRLRITNHGQVIDKKTRNKLFQKFYQSSDGKKAGGTGLGLAISRVIIEAHDGLVGVESSAEKGTTFWFEIPIKGKL